MIKGVLFDLDGTLVHLPTDYKIIQNELKKSFQTDEKFSPLIPTIIAKANGDQSKISKAFEMICEQEMIAVQNIQAKEEINDVLNFLKTKNCIMCLITMQCRKVVNRILDDLAIRNYFSNIFTRDESYDRSEQIQKTLEKMKLVPEQTLVIGDTVHDMECAKKANCQHILVSQKNESDNNLQTIKNLAEIKRMIDQ